jgi:hypothetical protein
VVDDLAYVVIQYFAIVEEERCQPFGKVSAHI